MNLVVVLQGRLKSVLMGTSSPVFSAIVNIIVVSFVGRTALSVSLNWLFLSTVVIFTHASLRRTSTHLKLLSRLQLLDKLSAMLIRERLQRQLPPEGWRQLVADVRLRLLRCFDRAYLSTWVWLLDVSRALSFERQSRIEERRQRRQARIIKRHGLRATSDCSEEGFHGPVYL